ncbi:Cuticle protein 16.8 like protein [Argiope bruennichi]|uniref:Cuticle protein 16.8 like protein n=1 Tax=Argiope bruennichi TaxID=94029 RepID=A0A8T0EIQ2_ARGBR|nr:Cuticle protein 16.8 like protein [Argiope bruennichi]
MQRKATLILVLVTFVAAVPFSPIEEIHKPLPYSFGYKIKDKHGEQHREETGDGVGVVKGSYGFTDERGIHRQVHYVADKAGFRAEVKTNEHGTASLDPAHVKMISSAHPYLGGAGAKVLGGPALAGLEAAKFLEGPALAGLEAVKLIDGPALAGLEAAKMFGGLALPGLETTKFLGSPALASLEADKFLGAALTAESPALFGGPVLESLEAPKFVTTDFEAKYPFLGSPLAVYGPAGYAAPLIGGAITGYDSRFKA